MRAVPLAVAAIFVFLFGFARADSGGKAKPVLDYRTPEAQERVARAIANANERLTVLNRLIADAAGTRFESVIGEAPGIIIGQTQRQIAALEALRNAGTASDADIAKALAELQASSDAIAAASDVLVASITDFANSPLVKRLAGPENTAKLQGVLKEMENLRNAVVGDTKALPCTPPGGKPAQPQQPKKPAVYYVHYPAFDLFGRFVGYHVMQYPISLPPERATPSNGKFMGTRYFLPPGFPQQPIEALPSLR